jgi:hypothetical protein
LAEVSGVVYWGNVFLVVAALGAAVYPIVYARSAWYESTVGRDTMTFAICTVIILVLSLAVRVFGLAGPPRAVIATGIYVLLAFLFWRRVWVLVQVQRDPWKFAARDEERAQRRAQRRTDHRKHTGKHTGN